MQNELILTILLSTIICLSWTVFVQWTTISQQRNQIIRLRNKIDLLHTGYGFDIITSAMSAFASVWDIAKKNRKKKENGA